MGSASAFQRYVLAGRTRTDPFVLVLVFGPSEVNDVWDRLSGEIVNGMGVVMDQ